jgi:hypothetical protein
MPYVFLALPGKENSRPVQHILTTPSGVLCRVCSLHCLVKNTRPVQYILTTPSGVFLMPCVLLALPGKETSRPVQHILTTPSGVFLMSCVLLAPPGKENSRPVQHILTTPSGVFLMPCVCSLHRLLKEQQTCATHSYNTLWCVFNAVCVFLTPPAKGTADPCNTFLQHPLACFYCNASCVLCTAW